MAQNINISLGLHVAMPYTFHQRWAYLITEDETGFYYREVDGDGKTLYEEGEPIGECGPYATIEEAYCETFCLVSNWAEFPFNQ